MLYLRRARRSQKKRMKIFDDDKAVECHRADVHVVMMGVVHAAANRVANLVLVHRGDSGARIVVLLR